MYRLYFDSVTACDSFDWDGTYDSTGLYTNVYTDVNGCDSTVTFRPLLLITVLVDLRQHVNWDGVTTQHYTNVLHQQLTIFIIINSYSM